MSLAINETRAGERKERGECVKSAEDEKWERRGIRHLTADRWMDVHALVSQQSLSLAHRGKSHSVFGIEF